MPKSTRPPASSFVRELGVLLAEDVPWIPLYVLPNLIAWNPEVLDGPGGWVSSVYGGFLRHVRLDRRRVSRG